MGVALGWPAVPPRRVLPRPVAVAAALRRRPQLLDTLLAVLLAALAVPRLGFIGPDARWPPTLT